MTVIRILNLYAGVGGNRRNWPDTVKITAVEQDEKIASVYKEFYPQDTIIIADAHQYLLEHYNEFDFIWSSPPCPTHSKMRYYFHAKTGSPIYPDMTLYQEIILLRHHAKNKWAIENVVSYYEPLIKPQIVGRHYIWANFNIPKITFPAMNIRHGDNKELSSKLGFNIPKYRVKNRERVLRNCTHPDIGLHILLSSGVI